jgi:hypothetical protein
MPKPGVCVVGEQLEICWREEATILLDVRFRRNFIRWRRPSKCEFATSSTRRYLRYGEAWSEFAPKVRHSALIRIDRAMVSRAGHDCPVFDVGQSANVARQVFFDPTW